MTELDAFLDLLMLLASDFRMGGLFVLLVMAAVSDVRFYRIPNWLTFGGAVFAIIYGTFAARTPTVGDGGPARWQIACPRRMRCPSGAAC